MKKITVIIIALLILLAGLLAVFPMRMQIKQTIDNLITNIRIDNNNDNQVDIIQEKEIATEELNNSMNDDFIVERELPDLNFEIEDEDNLSDMLPTDIDAVTVVGESEIEELSNDDFDETNYFNEEVTVDVEGESDLESDNEADPVIVDQESDNVVADPAITMEVFFSYQCGHCADFYQITESIRSWGDVEVIYSHYPIGSLTPAKGAVCAGNQQKFWEMHNLIFTNRIDFTVEAMRKHAQVLELDMELFDQCFEDDSTVDILNESKSRGRTMGVSAVPTTFINGEKIQGNVPIENLTRIMRKYKAQ